MGRVGRGTVVPSASGREARSGRGRRAYWRRISAWAFMETRRLEAIRALSGVIMGEGPPPAYINKMSQA